MHDNVLTTRDKKNEKFLKTKTQDFDFKKFAKKEINDILLSMKKIMRAARGVGLSANQVGYPFSMFVAEVPDAQGTLKFYAVFNPRIEKYAGEKLMREEGCLSVPGTYGTVERSERVVLSGFDKNGKPIKIKAWGLLAHVFQHETDHLKGTLFTSKAENLYDAPAPKRLAEREEKLKK